MIIRTAPTYVEIGAVLFHSISSTMAYVLFRYELVERIKKNRTHTSEGKVWQWYNLSVLALLSRLLMSFHNPPRHGIKGFFWCPVVLILLQG